MDEQEALRTTAGRRRKRLLRRWFRLRNRNFPWRQYQSPWHVLLAEMLLLRTRADVVSRHVTAIIERFPTPTAMAAATALDVENQLQPLGLRWRAHRLHELAEVIVETHHGQVPVVYEDLISLPGVGPYVASATLSALTGSPVFLTDANTVRVAKRVAGLRLEGDVRRTKSIQAAIRLLLGGESVLVDWLAVVDLAATVCLPRKPHCDACPIRNLCAYGLQNLRNFTSSDETRRLESAPRASRMVDH